jgi:lysine 6-dehydrogenase
MKIAVLGAGLMGRGAVWDLARADDVTHVGIFDIDEQAAREVAENFGNRLAVAARLDVDNEDDVATALDGYDAAMSCVTYKYNPGITRSAIRAGCHLVDLGGNNDVVKAQLEMDEQAERADVIVIPDCGLAPGLVAVLAADGLSKFDRVDSIRIRVGGLPQSPRPPLNYQMVFSAEGLVNEYWEPVVVLEDGEKKTVNPMTGLELLEFDGIGKLEAFYTSGGTSTLPDTLRGKLKNLDYKTIRYPGHCQQFRPMLEIGLAARKPVKIRGQEVEPREVFKAVLERNLSFSGPDMVLVRLVFEGERAGEGKILVYEIVDRQDAQSNLTSMMRMTSIPAAIVAWMAASGKITARGVKPQELVVDPPFFLQQLKKRSIRLTIKE